MTDQRDKYYARARSWAVDQQASQQRAARRGWWVAGGVGVIAILEAFALIALVPLKTVSTVPVLVDRQTGFVEVLNPDGGLQLKADKALTQSLLAQYVVGREGYDIADVGAEHHKVALWSGGEALKTYLELMPASNPKSPLRLYGRSAIVTARIKSVSQIGPQTAMVRFGTRVEYQDGRQSPAEAWIAVVTYRFSDQGLSFADRLANPLGFQVVRYHRDPETVAQPDTLTPQPEPIVASDLGSQAVSRPGAPTSPFKAVRP